MHLWKKYASMHATYEVCPLNSMARITVHSDDDDNVG